MKTKSFHGLLVVVMVLAMSLTMLSSMVWATVAEPDYSKYLWDAESLSDGTIAVRQELFS